MPVEENKYSLDFNKDVNKVSVMYQSCGKSLKGININSYDDLLDEFDTVNKYNLGAFNNYLIPSQISPIFKEDEENQYKGAVVGISLNDISKSEIVKFHSYNYIVSKMEKY